MLLCYCLYRYVGTLTVLSRFRSLPVDPNFITVIAILPLFIVSFAPPFFFLIPFLCASRYRTLVALLYSITCCLRAMLRAWVLTMQYSTPIAKAIVV